MWVWFQKAGGSRSSQSWKFRDTFSLKSRKILEKFPWRAFTHPTWANASRCAVSRLVSLMFMLSSPWFVSSQSVWRVSAIARGTLHQTTGRWEVRLNVFLTLNPFGGVQCVRVLLCVFVCYCVCLCVHMCRWPAVLGDSDTGRPGMFHHSHAFRLLPEQNN